MPTIYKALASVSQEGGERLLTAKADAFLTTDTNMLKKAASVQAIRILDPINFLRE